VAAKEAEEMRGREFLTIVIVAFLVAGSTARAQDAPTTKAFYENGSWNGEVTAYKWRGINTASAWAFGKHSQKNAQEACSGREGADRKRCIQDRSIVRRSRSSPIARMAWRGVTMITSGIVCQ
jgi:hypothetical protein